MVRRVGGLDCLHDGMDGADRIAWLFAGSSSHIVSPRTSCGDIVDDLLLALIGGTSSPIRAEATRLDEHHLDAERLDFLPESFGQAFHCKLGCVVVAERWERSKADRKSTRLNSSHLG